MSRRKDAARGSVDLKSQDRELSRKRLAERGETLSRERRLLGDELVELGFGEDFDAELLGLVELAAGFFAGDEVVGVFGDAARRRGRRVAR